MGKYSSSEMSIPFSFTINTFFFLTLLFLIQIQTYTVTADEMYTSCAPFSCGNFTDLTYPFWSQNTQPNYCGHPKFKLHCHHGSLTLDIMSQRFMIISINQTSQLLRIAREELYASTSTTTIGSCPLHYIDVKVDLDFFSYTSNDENYTLFYECNPLPDPDSSPLSSEVSEFTGCLIKGKRQTSYLVLKTRAMDFNHLECKHNITVHGLKNSFTNQSNTIEEGFEVRWSGVDDKQICQDCKKSGGRCGYDVSTTKVMCISPKKAMTPTDGVTPSNGAWNSKTKLILGVASGVLATMVVLMIAVYLYRRLHSSSYEEHHIESSLGTQRMETENNFGVHHYTYRELKHATNQFHEINKLGEGASGKVFYAKLAGEREIAVKKFKDKYPNAYDLFKNEVTKLGNLSHSNIVSLYGCTARNSRSYMLVYEYVSNGTVKDHLRGNKAIEGKLTWKVRMNIVVETARALKHLHSLKIIHRDIKTTNILLKDNLQAKVRDFGLSYDLPIDRSHVTENAKGTLGYLDPEYDRCRCLTLKSDVYSFGVVMIELITSLRAYDNQRAEDEEYLAHMARKRMQIQNFHEVVDGKLGFDSDSKIQEMINRVAELAIRCVEDESNTRPNMDDVLVTLEDIQSVGDPENQHEAEVDI